MYDAGVAGVARPPASESLYEVTAQSWADLGDESGAFGVAMLVDRAGGWDHPTRHVLRRTLSSGIGFATRDELADYVRRAGFVVDSIAVFPRPTPLPGDITGWLETFARAFTHPLSPAERAGYLAEVRQSLEPALCDASGTWTADYTRLRFAAHRS